MWLHNGIVRRTSVAPIGTNGATALGVPFCHTSGRAAMMMVGMPASSMALCTITAKRWQVLTPAVRKNGVNAFFFQQARDLRAGLFREFLLVAAAAHEAEVLRCHAADVPFSCQLAQASGEHAVDVLVDVAVVVAAVGYHHVFCFRIPGNDSVREVAGKVEALLSLGCTPAAVASATRIFSEALSPVSRPAAVLWEHRFRSEVP